MLGKVYTTIKQKENGISGALKSKIQAYESIATDLLNSVKSVDPKLPGEKEEEAPIEEEDIVMATPEQHITDSCRSRKSNILILICFRFKIFQLS